MTGFAVLVGVVAVLEHGTGVAGSEVFVVVVERPVTRETVSGFGGVARETGSVAVDALLYDVVAVLFELTEYTHGEQVVPVRSGVIARRAVLICGPYTGQTRGVTRVAFLVCVVTIVLDRTGNALACRLLEIMRGVCARQTRRGSPVRAVSTAVTARIAGLVGVHAVHFQRTRNARVIRVHPIAQRVVARDAVCVGCCTTGQTGSMTVLAGLCDIVTVLLCCTGTAQFRGGN